MNPKEISTGIKVSPVKQALAVLAGSLIFAGLPMVGWGLPQLSGFFENPARAAYVVVAVLLQLFAIYYNPQVGSTREKRKTNIPVRKIDLYLIQFFSIAIVLMAPYFDHHSIAVLNISDVVRFMGLILVILSFSLMLVAEKYLGKQFSVTVRLQEDHKLVQQGPYKWVRHPRYLGILLFFLSISVVFRSLLVLIMVAGLLFVLMWRISAEESLLREEFGKEWDDYCRRTRRLIPLVF